MNMQQIQRFLLDEASAYINAELMKATAQTSLWDYLDELDRVELIMLAEEVFDIELGLNADEDLTTVGALVCLIYRKVKEAV